MINPRKSLGLLFPAMRLSLALVLLTACLVLSADMFGFTPDEDRLRLQARKQISEALAVQFSTIDARTDIDQIETLLRIIVERNEELLSAGIRRVGGQLVFQSEGHGFHWQDYDQSKSTSSHVLVPLLDRGQDWGNVELRFSPLASDSAFGFLQTSVFKLLLFCLLIGFFVFLAFMLRTLRQLDPSAVIPERVNAAFDTLSEGVMIVDEDEQILLTNKAFCEKIGVDAVSLLGKQASSLKWERVSRSKSGNDLPWLQVLDKGNEPVRAQFTLKAADGNQIKFAINASPIEGEGDKPLGVLVTLDDITDVERRNSELVNMVQRLEKNEADLKEQAKELDFYATRDPLTS